MRLAPPRSRILGAAALAALLAASSPALAGWQDDYKEGRAALTEGKHNKAENLLRSAIAQKDTEKANAIKASGMFFEPYLPHFYLGMTLFQQKEYAGAIREFDISESQGVIGKDAALMAQLNQMRASAKVAAAASAPSPQPPPSPVAQPQPPAGGGEAVKPEPPPSGKPGSKDTSPPQRNRVVAEPLPTPPAGPDPALTRALDAAAPEVAAAQKLATESGNLLEPGEKSQLTSGASAVLSAKTSGEAESAHASLRSLRSNLERKAGERRQARAALETARKETAGSIRAAESFASRNRDALKPSERGRLTQEIASVRGADTADEMRAAERALSSDIEALTRTLRARAAEAAKPPAPSGPDPAIAAARKDYAAGVEAYFGGDFDKAVASLVRAGDVIGKDPSVHALLGSALYKRYLLTRSEDASLKARAEEAFRTAAAIRPGFKLDAKYYPPKVIAFYEQVASGAASGSPAR